MTSTTISKCIAGRARHPDDHIVVAAMANLPIAQDSERHPTLRAGIANTEGEVYRYIDVSGAFQLLHLTARLNARGFSVSTALRQARVGQYDQVFVKALRAQTYAPPDLPR